MTCLFRGESGTGVNDYGYGPEWVDKLARNVRRFHPDAQIAVVTDYAEDEFREPVEVFPFALQFKGFARLMECYRPEVVGEKAILVGLDQVFVGDLSALWDQPYGHIAPLDPHFGVTRGRLCNAVVLVDRKAAWQVWKSWLAFRVEDRPDYKYLLFLRGENGERTPVFSEMRWLSIHHRPEATWDDLLPGAVLSYKVHVRPAGKLPGTARVVYFHGNPKQPDLDESWVRDNWT